MAMRQPPSVQTPFQNAIRKQAIVDFRRQQIKDNDVLAFYVFAMAYALEFAIPVPHWTKSTSIKPGNHPPSSSPSSPKSNSELPHKLLWELCVILSVGCFLTIVSIQMMSWFARLLHAVSCHWVNVSPRSVKIRLRFTVWVIAGNMVLRSFLTHLPDHRWEFALLIPVLIHAVCTFGTKVAGGYFESPVPESQNLTVLLALHEAGYLHHLSGPNLPPPPPPSPSPPPPPPPSPAILQPTPPPSRCRSSPVTRSRSAPCSPIAPSFFTSG